MIRTNRRAGVSDVEIATTLSFVYFIQTYYLILKCKSINQKASPVLKLERRFVFRLPSLDLFVFDVDNARWERNFVIRNRLLYTV